MVGSLINHDPNLVSHWRLDEIISNVTPDSAGGNDGLVNGAKPAVAGKFGSSLFFDGSDDYVAIGDLGITGDWTVTFWAKLQENNGVVYYPVGLNSPYAGIRMGGVHMYVRQHLLIYPDDGTRQLSSKRTIDKLVWYHVAVVHHGKDYKIYINGRYENSAELLDIDLADFYIGVRPDLKGDFIGWIDDVGVWNRALDLGDAADPPEGTVNYVKINGVSGPDFNTAWNPQPTPDQEYINIDVKLQWRSLPSINEHRIYIGTDPVEVETGTIPDSITGEPYYFAELLDADTVYYWRVDEVSGTDVYKGKVWSFKTCPNRAFGPFPIDDSMEASADSILKWSPGADLSEMVEYKVYFGMDLDSVYARRIDLTSDFTNDGRVDLSDLVLMMDWWLECDNDLITAFDLSQDDCIDMQELCVLAGEWLSEVAVSTQSNTVFYDPGVLEYGRTYYWAVDEYDGDNIYPGEVWNFMVGIDPPELTNADTYLTTPTYEGSGQGMHPSVLYMPSGWNGYEYWMAMTPYPYYYSSAENPSILGSHDGLGWSVPNGLVNPLINQPNPGYNADPDIVYNDLTDELWIYFLRRWTDTDIIKLTLMRSSDGRIWSDPEYLITWDQNITEGELSFSIIKQGDDWYYWALNFYSPSKLVYRYSTDGKVWSSPQNITFTFDPYVLPWHLDVIHVPEKSEYWMLFNGPASPGGRLFFAKSKDRLTWTPSVDEVLLSSACGWDNDILYRSTLLYDNENDLLKIWYSAANYKDMWHTGYIETHY